MDKGLVSEKDLESAVGNARVNQIDVATVLIEDLKVPKEEIGRALAQFYNAAFVDLAGRTMPADLKERLNAEVLKKNMCAPIEKREGTLWWPSRTPTTSPASTPSRP